MADPGSKPRDLASEPVWYTPYSEFRELIMVVDIYIFTNICP